jgi:hypothetical protein
MTNATNAARMGADLAVVEVSQWPIKVQHAKGLT